MLAGVLTVVGVPSAWGEEGVLAELPFLDSGPTFGELFAGHIRLNLSPRPQRRPFPMLLDTGATVTMMTPRYARALRVSVRRVKDDYYRKSTILGREVQFRVDTSWSDTMHRSGLEVGLLGVNFLEDYVIEVDYRAKKVRFLDPRLHAVDEERPNPGELILSMGMINRIPTVEIELAGRPLQFMIDTGSPGALLISEEKARELGIEIPEDAGTVHGRSLYGRDVRASFYVPSVRIGPRLEQNVILNVTLREGSTFRVTNLLGPDEALVGNRFLSRFRVRFDFAHGRLGLLPQVAPAPPEAVLAHIPRDRLHGTPNAGGASTNTDRAGKPDMQPVFVPVDLSPARAAQTFEQEVWVELEPSADSVELRSPVPYFDLSGWAGAGQPLEHDVMVVVDISGSTAVASGSDVDGDGKVGRGRRRKREAWRNFNPAMLSSDAGDTVLAAELLAMRRLVGRMGPGRTRIGILTFSSTPRLEAPLGSDATLLERTLKTLDSGFGTGGTNMAAAVRMATEALILGRPGGDAQRHQSILILSDGYPTMPVGGPEDAAWEAAREAADLGIRVYTFALGLGELQPDDVFVEMAMISGGGHVRLDRPGEVVHELALINLTEVTEISIHNLSNGRTARALRVFPDGSFDALVPLQPGENQIQVSARGNEGGEAVAELQVLYHRPEPGDDAESRRFAAEIEAFREKLKMRTIETLLATRASTRAEAEAEAERELEIEVEE
jgi:predicted aspartyl protease